MAQHPPDVAIIDYLLPDGNALEVLPRLRQAAPSMAVIILTGHGSIDLAVRAIKGKHASVSQLEEALRALPRPVISRIADRTLWLDLRCLEPEAEPEFIAQLQALRL